MSLATIAQRAARVDRAS